MSGEERVRVERSEICEIKVCCASVWFFVVLGGVCVFVVSTIICPRMGSVHKVARRLMHFKGIDAAHSQPFFLKN